MRLLYSIILYLLTPLIVLRLLWRSRRLVGYRQRMAERFGFFQTTIAPGGMWVHAVSVGEVIAAAPLIKQMKQAYPSAPLIITTSTPTGSDQVRRLFPEDSVFHVYAPYDLPDVVQRFLEKIRPKVAIMMETELWPNILHYCHQRHIPTIIANARLSARSAAGYARLKTLTKRMLRDVTLIIAQADSDAARFIALGMEPQRVVVSGSMKFDLQLPASLSESAEILRQQWGAHRPVWIAASTHEGEEEQVLDAFAFIQAALPQALLVLVPRHPDRFQKIMQLVKKRGHQMVLRSSGEPCSGSTSVFFGDTMGELLLFYAASDLAFVGGSLVPTGGHNILEPAALGLPIIVGPHMFNFAQITELLKTSDALIQISDKNELANTALGFLQDSLKRAQTGEKGRQVVLKNRGALATHLRLLQAQMG